MTGPARAAGARRPKREGDIAQVGDQPRSIKALSAEIEISRVAMRRTAIDGPAIPERSNRRVPELLHMIVVAGHSLFGKLCGGAEADAQRRGQRTRAKSPFLAATMDERRRLGTLSHPKRADSLGPVDLVR